MSRDRAQRLSLADERRIDAVCARFEAAVQAGDDVTVDGLVDREELRLRPRLREELESLRRELTATTSPSGSPRPTARRLGGYRILEKIGEGGMGTVFEAVQETTRRRVALKVVRSDLGSDQVRRRFEREARLLGHLHHPGIAQIFDAGIDEDADPDRPTPFLVMELLRGRQLIAHADEYRLGVRERLELVRRVCGAVQHAHDQGIVHRDLKPANILVVDDPSTDSARGETTGSTLGTPKVLDFGVARVLERGLDASVETHTGQIVGTVAYMSPEQLDGDSGKVDGRADVYALGVVLYQLLAGRLPHDVSGMSVPSAVDVLRRVEPTALGKLDPRLRGDIEIIVGKALEKEPHRRYATATALAADLQRHLDDVPIDARPPDAVDRLAKFARRNRGLFGGIVTAVAALLVSLVVVSVFAYRQAHLREVAETARAEASQRERVASAVSDFLNDMLRGGDLTRGGVTRETTLFEVLENAAREVDTAFPEDPLSRAAVRLALGASFLSQAEFEAAETQFRTARATYLEHYPADSEKVAGVESSLAQTLEELGRLDEAEDGLRRALAIRRALDPEGGNRVSSALNNLAALLERRGNYDGALALHREALTLNARLHGKQSIEYATTLNNLASVHEQVGAFDDAERLYRECVTRRRELLESPHPHLANAINNLGILLYRCNRNDEAEPLLREALAMRLELFDEAHPHVAFSRMTLGAMLNKRGDRSGAADLYRQSLDALVARLGEDHPDVHAAAVNLAFVLTDLDRLDEAYALLAPAVASLREHYGPRHQTTLWATGVLAKAEGRLGHADRALELYRTIAATQLEEFGDHPRTARALINRGLSERDVDDADAALASFRAAAEMAERLFSNDHYDRLRARVLLADQLATAGRDDEARTILRADTVYADALADTPLAEQARSLLDELARRAK